MTALAGLWNFNGAPDAGQSCQRMLAAQAIYGPDADSFRDLGDIALGRRLFITLPEDVHDRQPLAGGDGRFVLVADLRLDNRDELARDLGIPAPDAARHSDADLLLAAWERWEDRVFEHLLGDYAFAVWDGRERRLVLARDPLGARPLHFHRGAGFFAFASMPKGLHALPDIPHGPDEVRMAEFLALLPEAGPRSFFKDIQRVESGHIVVATASGTSSRRHWTPSRKILTRGRADDYAEGLRHHLDRAVQVRWRRAGGPAGTTVSAGLESEAVAATAARLLAPQGDGPIAFTSVPRKGYEGAAPPGRFGDETELARATAALYPNLDHVLVRSGDRGIMDDFDRNFFLFERPVVNACNQMWINAINAQAQKRGVRVLLTGAVGNLTLSYAGRELLPELAAAGRWLRLFQEGRAMVRAGEARWRGVLAQSLGPWIPERLWVQLQRLAGGHVGDLASYSMLNADRQREVEIDSRAADLGFDLAYRPRTSAFDARLDAMRRVDSGNQNKGALAGWGVDVRDPTGDQRLVEYCLSLPTDAFMVEGRPRALARRALADRLPDIVLSERRKGLQAIDWHESMTASRDQIADEVARLAEVPAAATALNLPRMRQLVENWPTGNWNSRAVSTTYRLALLRGVANGHFLRKASRSNA